MGAPLAIFYHSLFFTGEPPTLSPTAFAIVQQQLNDAHACGLLAAASHFCAGINGGEESRGYAALCFPESARLVFHGLQSRCENPTLRELEQWLPAHPGWHVLYFHAKGATHPRGDKFRDHWRECMMERVVRNWRRCVADLDSGYESVGCHWLAPPVTPPEQYIWGGNFWWAKSDYLRTLPSLVDRLRIKLSGIDAFESRYEAEVWIGNGPRRPRVHDYHHAHPTVHNVR